MKNEIGQRLKSEQRHGRNWVQTERAAHEAWSGLIAKAPTAAQLMHVLVSQMGEGNAVVASQTTLGELLGRQRGKAMHRNTVRKAIQTLESDKWIEVIQIGGKGGALGYVINNRVAWHGSRDQIRYARFSAQVVTSETEQPESIDDRPELRRVPTIMHGEEPLPVGPGEPPPSQQLLEGMEPTVERSPDEAAREELERRGQSRIDYGSEQ